MVPAPRRADAVVALYPLQPSLSLCEGRAAAGDVWLTSAGGRPLGAREFPHARQSGSCLVAVAICFLVNPDQLKDVIYWLGLWFDNQTPKMTWPPTDGVDGP